MAVPSGRLLVPWRRAVVAARLPRRRRPGRASGGATAPSSRSPPSVLSALVRPRSPWPPRGVYRAAGRLDRAALQWIGWGVVAGATVAVSAWGLDALLGWPAAVGMVAVAATVARPAGVRGRHPRPCCGRVDRLLVHTVVVAGLVAARRARLPRHRDRPRPGARPTTSGRCSCCRWSPPAVAAVLALPARRRLAEIANRLVYGERHAPDEVLRTFGSRLTRADPDGRAAAAAGRVAAQDDAPPRRPRSGPAPTASRAGGVGARPRRRRSCASTAEEQPVVTRAGVSGNAWVAGVAARAARRARGTASCGSRRSPTPASCSA